MPGLSQARARRNSPPDPPDLSSEMSEQPEHAGYELAYQEGLRAITQQQAVLDGLHRRAGTILAVASIVTSFLGSIVPGDGGPTGLAWIAVLFFVAAAGLVAYVLAPRRAWYFRSEPTDIIRGYVEDEPSAPLWAMQRQLAEHFETDFTANEKNMKPLFRAYQLANLALAGEVIVWIIILIER
jgi:hypothetical protein